MIEMTRNVHRVFGLWQRCNFFRIDIRVIEPNRNFSVSSVDQTRGFDYRTQSNQSN